MPITTEFLRNIMSEARPIIERQMDDAKVIAGLRTVVANNGGDWGALKALIKAHIEDEADDAGEGKRVQKILDKADSSTAYADMLGLANVNEKNFSHPEAKASDDNGATVQAKGLPADSVAGDASRPSEGGGPLVSSAGEKPAPDNLNVRGDSRERPALDFPDPQAAIEKVATATNSDFPEMPSFLKRGNVVESV